MKKSDFSMQSVRTLFRLDVKSRFGTTHKIGVKNRILQIANYLFFAVVYAVLILGIVYLSKMFIGKAGLTIEFLTLVTMATMILATAAEQRFLCPSRFIAFCTISSSVLL